MKKINKEAELAFAVAAERRDPDVAGRTSAVGELLALTQQAANAAGWHATEFGTPPHQVTFGLRSDHQHMTIHVDKVGCLLWSVEPLNRENGIVDCVVYNPVEKTFNGAEGKPTDAVAALAQFVVSKLAK
jgi:hypothetical protein